MTMHYEDDRGHGLGHLNDDVDPCDYSETPWNDEKAAIAERVSDYVGLPNIFRFRREKE